MRATTRDERGTHNTGDKLPIPVIKGYDYDLRDMLITIGV
jgi:hypothetical protein